MCDCKLGMVDTARPSREERTPGDWKVGFRTEMLLSLSK
jgi:hypothetical protein